MSEQLEHSYRSHASMEALRPKVKKKESLIEFEKNTNVSKGDQANKQFSGLVQESCKTENYIIDGFWMQGGFAILFTIDDTNLVHLETFQFDDEQKLSPVCEKIFLCNKSKFVKIQTTISFDRHMICVLTYNTQSKNQCEEQIKGYLIDFRKFNETFEKDDILIRDIKMNTIFEELQLGREIYDIHPLFVNETSQSYSMELLFLVSCVNPPDFVDQDHIFLFGVHMDEIPDGNDDEILCYKKELKKPMVQRPFRICGFFQMLRNESIVVFEDGVVWTLDSENNNGVTSKGQLKLPFDRATTLFYETEQGILMFQNDKLDRAWFVNDGDGWQPKKINIPKKYTIIKMIGKFVIVSYNEGLTYLVEMKGEEMGLQVQLGDETVWNYNIDADARESSFVFQFEKGGKNFLWQKFDQQRQFHLTKARHFETVCNNCLIRIHCDGARLEIKKDLSRFEDRFYNFIPLDFEGIQITVSSFQAYVVPGDADKIFLIINPKPSVVKTSIQKQYLVIVNLNTLKAYNCKVVNDLSAHKISKVFFFGSDGFLGQIKVNSVMNKIIKYEITHQELEGGLLEYYVTQQRENLSINMKRINAAAFDPDLHCLFCIRECYTEDNQETADFSLYMLDLKKMIEGSSSAINLADVDIVDVSVVVKKFKVFTEPLSVFKKDETLFGASCYIQENKQFYYLVGNSAFSLLFRTDLRNMRRSSKGSPEDFTVKFEQLITIKNPKELLSINDKQLLAVSNTQVVIFRRDETECDDMAKYFDPGNTEIQNKRLVGKNIDIKVDFQQAITSITCEKNVIALIFGRQSVLLELDEMKSTGDPQNTQVTNLNDLVLISKRVLKNQYMMDGYIHITEEQGDWDSIDPKLPIILKAADFVTVFQDDDGNQGSDESGLIKNLYFLEYNIWESLIRDGMLQGDIPITHDQLARFLTPVMTDHNNNLLHHFSYNRLDQLETILEMPGFEDYFDLDKKMFPIFYNFFGETQINIALSAHDNPSFYKLLDVFVRLQPCIESSFLVSTWLLKAFEEGLDIIELLNSQIIQTQLNEGIVEHWKTWPEFHKMTDQLTVNYDKAFLSLMHDEAAYNTVLGETFPTEQRDQQSLHQQALGDERKELLPIIYYAERLPVFAANEDEQYENIFKLLEILAETEQLGYFRCGYVTRLIEWMWDSQLVRFYNIVSGMYMMSYLLIVVASVMLRYFHSHQVLSSEIRLSLLALNLLILILSLGTFEVKSMIENKLAYFESFWNKNDMMLFCMSIVCLGLEIKNLKYQLHKLEGRNLAEVVAEAAATGQVVWDAGFNYPQYYKDYDKGESLLRCMYSILIINIHIKLLNVLSFYVSVAFVIKAMQRVIEDIQGYGVFFFFLVLMYALAYNALDLLWLNSDALTPEGDFRGMGGMPFAFFIATYRMSLGDFILNTFRFPGNPITVVAWIVFLTQMIIQFFLMMNFAIQIAEGGYNSVSQVQVEEAYQKKCDVICELNEVFGKIASRKSTNILITRVCIQEPDYNMDTDETVTGVKKQQAANKIETLKGIDALQKTISTQNNKIIKEMAELTRLIKKRGEKKGISMAHVKTRNSAFKGGKTEGLNQLNTANENEKPEILGKLLEGNLSSYRTSNIDYGSLMDESYFSEY